MPVGHVSLVGAGPGDPELWTLKAVQRVRTADIVLYDALVDARALRELTDAPCFCVGKRGGRRSMPQDTDGDTTSLLFAHLRVRRVLRTSGLGGSKTLADGVWSDG